MKYRKYRVLFEVRRNHKRGDSDKKSAICSTYNVDLATMSKKLLVSIKTVPTAQ